MKEQDILNFWRDIEIVDIPDLNKEATILKPNENLPWLSSVIPPKKHYKWSFTLIFGKIEKKQILEHLNTLLKTDEVNDWEEPVQGFSCFSTLSLDEEGRPQQDSYVVASYVFGIKALEGYKVLSTVSSDLENAKEDFLERYNIPKISLEDDKDQNQPKGDIVTSKHIEKEIEYLKKHTLWCNDEIKVFLLAEELPKDSEQNTGFLNSFFLDDLNYLSRIEKKQYGKALLDYLTIEPTLNNRKDLIQQKQFLFDSINPKNLTAGKWPSNTDYGLYTAQFGAVNTIFSNLRNSTGIQGVNGPPGTGKTTLLLDVIAEVIVERAKVISGLGCDNIFKRGGYRKVEKESGYPLHTYLLDAKFQNNFGIVIASNNNAAVENISKELPAKSKIDTTVFENADYFSKCSTQLIQEASWGVLAAALGNAKNRNNFRKAFWVSNQEKQTLGFEDLLYSIYKDENNNTTHQYRESFEAENKKFKSLVNQFEGFKKIANQFHELLPEFVENRKREASIVSELKQIDKSLFQLSNEKQTLTEVKNSLERDTEKTQSALQLHTQLKPSLFFFQKLLNTNSFKQWNEEAGGIISQLNKINSELNEIKEKLGDNSKETKQFISKRDKLNNLREEITSFFTNYNNLQKKLTDEYEIEPKYIFDVAFTEKDISDIHLLYPYHSSKIAKLRSDIFLSALQLHHDAILANAKNFRNNLKTYFEMTSGWVKVDAEISQNLWDSFFFCVPVVSTTLASAGRLFPNLSKEQIGWLLIDEAGQATPQSAAGIIHRAKRCVIVGDPLQVEPVVTMPEKLTTKIRNEHKVSLNWSPYQVSVQQLADRVSTNGTYMTTGDSDEKIWTGFPLRTHRRCDDPMFSIANEIAYSNQMVNGIDENSKEVFIGKSSWFNVSTEITLVNKHVILEEITLLQQKIQELRDVGYSGSIYVISPFKSIANYCKNTFRTDEKVSCGTIHKFQGKEANIVFLVLGSNPQSSGARNWASQKPNMLNVALTRAKKRFYVIGNKNLWGSCDYFNVMVNTIG